MKTALKVLTALAAVVGVVYVIATYGEQLVAWAKKMLASCPCKNCTCEDVQEVTEEAPAEAPAEEAPAAEEVAAQEPEVEIVIEENEPVAEETDFEA